MKDFIYADNFDFNDDYQLLIIPRAECDLLQFMKIKNE